MSSSGDPTHGPGEFPQGRIFVPQGPMWDAWVAADGGAVKFSVQVMKTKASWLRRSRPRPFGFALGSAPPARIGEAHGAGTLSSGFATVLGLRNPVQTMSILYGHAADHSGPADPFTPTAEIISDFHQNYQDHDLEDDLLAAARKWTSRVPAPDPATGAARATGARPEVTSATVDVVVSGRRRPVSMLRLGVCSAFQVRDDGVLVTVLTTHMGPPFPDIVRLTDLEPMLFALEHPDREAIAAAFAEKRRQQIEQMRNQDRQGSGQ
jgi:hypothetical protein